MELRTNEKIIICAMILLIALFSFIVIVEQGFQIFYESYFNYYVRYLMLIIISAVFFGTLAGKTLQKGIAKSISILGFSLGALFFCRTMKLVVENDGLGRFFWYLFYPCWFGIALGFLGIVYFSETATDETNFPKWWKSLAWVSVILSAVVLSNDEHQQVFKFLPGFVNYNRAYYEGFAGYAIKLFLLGEFAFGNIWLLYKAIRSSFYRVKIFLPAVVLSVTYMYLLGYTFRWCGLNETEVATFTGLACIAYLCACIYSKLILLNIDYEKAFEKSQLGMKIINKSGETVYASADAKETKVNYILHSLDIKNGSVIWQEDISDLLVLEQSLKEQNLALARTESILLQEENVQGEALDLKLRNSIFDDVERIIESKRERLAESLALVKTDRERGIQLLKLITGFLKKRCMLFVASKADGLVNTLELRMSMQETTVFAREAGLNTAFRFEYDSERIDGISACLVYDSMECIIWNGLKYGSLGFMINVNCTDEFVNMTCLVDASETWLKDTYKELAHNVKASIFTYNETEDAISISMKMGRGTEV